VFSVVRFLTEPDFNKGYLPMKEKRRSHRFFRINKVRAYLLIKSIKHLLKEQERKRNRK